MEDMRPQPAGHPDRSRWNARYRRYGSVTTHPLAARALSTPLPDGPVLDLACGPSGAALLAAGSGRAVTAVDISEVALDLLAEQARDRGLGDLIDLVHADLRTWRPMTSYALVLCTGYWDKALFAPAAEAVAPAGLLGWEAFTTDVLRERPHLPPEWCLEPGEPACLLPHGFTVLDHADDRGKRRLLARRRGG